MMSRTTCHDSEPTPAVPSQLVLNDTLRVFDPPLHISLVVERCAETVTASRSIEAIRPWCARLMANVIGRLPADLCRRAGWLRVTASTNSRAAAGASIEFLAVHTAEINVPSTDSDGEPIQYDGMHALVLCSFMLRGAPPDVGPMGHGLCSASEGVLRGQGGRQLHLQNRRLCCQAMYAYARSPVATTLAQACTYTLAQARLQTQPTARLNAFRARRTPRPPSPLRMLNSHCAGACHSARNMARARTCRASMVRRGRARLLRSPL